GPHEALRQDRSPRRARSHRRGGPGRRRARTQRRGEDDVRPHRRDLAPARRGNDPGGRVRRPRPCRPGPPSARPRRSPPGRGGLARAGQHGAGEAGRAGGESVEMVARLYGQGRLTAHRNAARVLGQLGLTDAADRLVRTYSGGMRRRLDLGASLVGAPRLLLLDEPTTGLDPGSRLQLWDALRQLVAAGTDVVLTPPSLDEADQLAADIIIIDHGKVIAAGTPAELKTLAGDDVIEVHVRDAEALPDVAAVLSDAGRDPRVDRATRRVSVAVDDGTRRLMEAMRA